MNGTHPDNNSDAPPEPPRLRLLRLLVTVLTATLIIGFVIIVGLLVTMVMRSTAQSVSVVPEEIILPAGETALSYSRGTDWIAVVTRSADGAESIRIFALDGKALKTIAIGNEIGSE